MLSRIVFSFIVSKWTCFLVNIIHDMYVSVLQVPLFSFLFFSFLFFSFLFFSFLFFSFLLEIYTSIMFMDRKKEERGGI